MIRTLTSVPNPLAPTRTFCLALLSSEAGNQQNLSNERNVLSMPSSEDEEGRAHDTGPRRQLRLQSPVRPPGAGVLNSSTHSGEDDTSTGSDNSWSGEPEGRLSLVTAKLQMPALENQRG